MSTMVQIYECADGHRRPTHRLPLGRLIREAIGRLPPREVAQLRDDLTILGRSRIDDTMGRWREYVLVDDGAAGA